MLESLIVTMLYPFILNKGGNRVNSLNSSRVSDAEIIDMCHTTKAIDANTVLIHMYNAWNKGVAHHIYNDTVVKRRMQLFNSELLVAEFVRQRTCIPVPFHQRYIPPTLNDPKSCIVMQFIQGTSVSEVWSTLSWWMKFRICATVRYYVYQLRRLPGHVGIDVPGPLGSEIDRPYCSGRLFSEGGVERSLVASYRDLCRWYSERLEWMQLLWHTPLRENSGAQTVDIPPFDRSRPLAIVHQDLHPKNMILGSDGQLWIIDWEWAGVYPDWFEYGNAILHAEASSESDIPFSWRSWIPWMFGRFEGSGQMPFIRTIMYTLQRLPDDITESVEKLRARKR
ncbi:hypothetical protein VKT23_018130 [Stygiomarasmius scandens]|uniref:Aminoglycoside phosphotransferase domain-containing protein n=1 Tax=Marasmiellus scandens TaxID=2682957 RepID=A0ABR1IPZ8_9AGAR